MSLLPGYHKIAGFVHTSEGQFVRNSVVVIFQRFNESSIGLRVSDSSIVQRSRARLIRVHGNYFEGASMSGEGVSRVPFPPDYQASGILLHVTSLPADGSSSSLESERSKVSARARRPVRFVRELRFFAGRSDSEINHYLVCLTSLLGESREYCSHVRAFKLC